MISFQLLCVEKVSRKSKRSRKRSVKIKEAEEGEKDTVMHNSQCKRQRDRTFYYPQQYTWTTYMCNDDTNVNKMKIYSSIFICAVTMRKKKTYSQNKQTNKQISIKTAHSLLFSKLYSSYNFFCWYCCCWYLL